MKRNNSFFYFILWVLLIAVVLIISNNKSLVTDETVVNEASLPEKVQVNAVPTPVAEKDKMIGIWIPYMALQTNEGTEESFKKNYIKMVKDAKDFGVNTLFVHVRAFGDALYKSDLYPWSHLITGTQGKDPGFDPLEFMINETHKNDMKFHAWINPLRVRTTQTPDVLSEDNPYTVMSESNPYYFLNIEGAIYLNPAYKEIRALIADGAEEIAANYPVDGIQFDDYFYPDNIGDADAQAYESYVEGMDNPVSIDVWRVANINSMISMVYRQIKSAKENIIFGISPQGNINNNFDLGADVYSWCSTKGYIDYICPQIYFSYDNPALGFKQALDEWIEIPKHQSLELYIGLGLYKAGTDEDSGTWKNVDNVIASQIADLEKQNFRNIIIFDIRSLTDEKAKNEVSNAKSAISKF